MKFFIYFPVSRIKTTADFHVYCRKRKKVLYARRQTPNIYGKKIKKSRNTKKKGAENRLAEGARQKIQTRVFCALNKGYKREETAHGKIQFLKKPEFSGIASSLYVKG